MFVGVVVVGSGVRMRTAPPPPDVTTGVLIVTDTGDEVFPAGSVSVTVIVCGLPENGVDTVYVPSAQIVVRAPGLTVTVFPLVHTPVTSVGDAIPVAPSVGPVIVKPVGAVVSIVKFSVGDFGDSPTILVKVDSIVCGPSAIGDDGVMVYVLPLHTCVGVIATLSMYRVTVSPSVHVPVKSGVVSFVMLSVFDVPESVEVVRSGAVVGAGGVEILTKEGLDTLLTVSK